MALTAVLWGTKDCECQVQRAALHLIPADTVALYVWYYFSHMLNFHIIYYGEIKDIGEWHQVRNGRLRSLGRAAGRAMAFDSRLEEGGEE